jgi:tetratricopeptide (TPR) repeat protein
MWNHNAVFRPLSNRAKPELAGDAAPPDESPLDRATRHARAGHYDSALSLLERLAQEGPTPDAGALDLRARIYAQLGFHLEAERCWVRAMAADPANPLYPLALERLRQARRRPFGARRVALFAVSTVAVAILVAHGLQQASALREIEHRLATANGLLETTGAAVAELSARVTRELPVLAKEASVIAHLGALQERQSRTATDLTERLDALATAVRTDSDAEQAAREQTRLELLRMEERLDRLQQQSLGGFPRPADTAEAPQAPAESSPESAARAPDTPNGSGGSDAPAVLAPSAPNAP